MKIKTPPTEINVNKIIEKEIDKVNSKCPFCGENKKATLIDIYGDNPNGIQKEMVCKSWYGKHDELYGSIFSWFRFWEKSHHWKVDCYKCYTCGAEWETDPYPTDIDVDIDYTLLLERNRQ